MRNVTKGKSIKKAGWGLLFVFMLLLTLSTRVTLPVSLEAVGFDLWALFLAYVTFISGRKLWQVVFTRPAPLTIENVRTDSEQNEAEDEEALSHFALEDRTNSKELWMGHTQSLCKEVRAF